MLKSRALDSQHIYLMSGSEMNIPLIFRADSIYSNHQNGRR